MPQIDDWGGSLVAMAVQRNTAFCCLGSVGGGLQVEVLKWKFLEDWKLELNELCENLWCLN